MPIKIYVYLVVGVLLMGVSYYAYATTKKLGVAEQQRAELQSQIAEVRELAEIRGKEIEQNRVQHTAIEGKLINRIKELSYVKPDACFDRPIPAAAANVLLQLTDKVYPSTENPSGTDSTDSSTNPIH